MDIVVKLLALYGLYCLFFGCRTKCTVKITKTASPNLPKNHIEFSDPDGEYPDKEN